MFLKFTGKLLFEKKRYLIKTLLIMKFIIILLFAACLQVSATGYSQTITLSQNNVSLKKVFREIERQSGYNFLYKDKLIRETANVSINMHDASVEAVLVECFKNQPLTYSILDKIIVIKAKKHIPLINPVAILPAPVNIFRGTVKDEKGNPLAGVSVIVKGTKKGTSTSTDGSFSIDANVGDVLEFSIVGYREKSILVGQNNNISLVMEVEAAVGSEIVVVGYGTEKKADLTGSVASVSSKQIENRPITNITNALEGTVAGVTVVQNNGQPGYDAGTINIRGVGTLNNSNPMIVVDGNIVSSMNDINPNDIASVTVLKDAASAAIYGSRAANGVIIITTKRGKAGTSQIRYSDYFGKQQATRLPDWAPSWQAATLFNEATVNEGGQPVYTDAEIDSFKLGNSPYNFPNTNWLGLLYTGNGFQQSHNLSASGGNDKTQYYLSVGYFDQNGLTPKTNTKRYNVRLNLTSKVTDNISVFANLSYTLQPTLQPQSSYPGVPAFSQLIRQANRISNIIPYKYANGDYGYIADGSPMAWLNSPSFDNLQQTNYQGIVGADWEIIKNLHFRPQLAYVVSQSDDNNFIASIQYYSPQGAPTFLQAPNYASETYQQSTAFTPQMLLDYSWKIGRNNDFKALAGYSQELDNWHELYGYRQNFLNNALSVINLGSPTGQVTKGDATQLALRSYFGRINYNYKDKYLLEGNLRYDGSSRFAATNQYGIFPSASAGWRISKESFFKSLTNIVSDLKLRASWGKLGNQNVAGNYPTIPVINAGQNYVFGGTSPVVAAGIAQTAGVDPSISWETTTESDLGLDASFLRNTISLTADYFIKNTTGILYALPVAASYGLTAPVVNAASVRNQGLELTIGYQNKIGAFRYNIIGNAAFIKNEVTSLAGIGPVIGNGSIMAVGLPINSYYGYVAQGFFKDSAQVASHASQTGISPNTGPGDIMYKDISGPNGKPDGVIDTHDEKYLGNNFPKVTFGLTVNFGWKQFDLTAFLQGTAGVKQYGATPGSEGNAAGKPEEALWDSWTPTNTSAAFPRPAISYTQNYVPSSFWVKDAAYIRMKNLQLGYTLPAKLTKRMHMQKLRIYYSGQNVFTFSQFYKWVDPETAGNSLYDYPQVKVNSLGLDATF